MSQFDFIKAIRSPVEERASKVVDALFNGKSYA
jgi:hypothetical protein